MQEMTKSLLNLKEVLALKHTILWQVSAVNSILYTVATKLGSQSVGTQVLCNFGVHWPTQLSERCDCVLLSHFKYETGSICHCFTNGHVFWEHSPVNFQKFFSSWFIQVKELHRWNLKSFLQDIVDCFTCLTSFKHMRLNHYTCAVVEQSSRGNFWTEE